MRIYGLWEELSKIIFRSNTRKVTVEPASQTTGDATITIPDMAGTSQQVVLSSQAQTITNKTIDADSNTITNIENADIKAAAAIARSKLASGTASHVIINDGAGAFSSEAQLATSRGGTGVNSTATFPASGVLITRTSVDQAGNRLTNKDLEDATTQVVDSSDTSKVLKFDVGGSVSTMTTLTTAQTANRVVTLPDATTTLVGTDATQTLSNKTIDGDVNTLQDIGITSLKTILGDASKFIARDGAGAVVSVNQVPTGTVVGTTDTQTLTNKTLGSTNTLTGATAASFTNTGTVTLPTSGTLISSTDTGTVTSTMIANGTIVNDDINASAAIAQSKMAALTASKVAITDASGFVTTSMTSSTEIGYVAGLTSAVQTQIDGKISDNILTTRGDILYRNASNVTDNLPIGTVGQVLSTDGVDAFWSSPAGTGDVTAAANIGDNRLVRGDGGAKGIQQSGITISDTDVVTGVVDLTTSGIQYIADGSSGSPSIAFTNDTDTGIYRPTTNTIGLVAGGGVRARATIVAGNSVNIPAFSIGPAAPTAATPFYFQTTGGAGAIEAVDAKFENTNTTAGSYMGIRTFSGTGGSLVQTLLGSYYNDGSYIGSISSHPVYLTTGGSTRATISTTGNMGIGVTPTEMFHIKKQQNATTTLLLENQDTTNSSSRARLRVLGGTVIGEITSIAGDGAYFGTNSNHPLYFMTNGSARGILTAGGQWDLSADGATFSPMLYIGNSAASATSSTAMARLRYTADTDCTGGYFMTFGNSANATIGRIEASSNTATAYTTSSDSRLKSQLSDFQGVNLVSQIKVGEFHWLEKPDVVQHGVLAQELYEVLPEAVSKGTDEVNEEGTLLTPWAVDYGRLTPVLIKAIQELAARVEELENK